MDEQQEHYYWVETFNPEFLKGSVISNDSRPFRWNERRSNAAIALALGHTEKDVAGMVGVTDRAIRKWKAHQEFSAEVNRLSQMVGVAARAERLRIAQVMIRELICQEVPTKKDLLDWLKYVQSEMIDVKLDLALLEEAQAGN